MNSERIAINVQKSALKKSMDALEERDREILRHETEANFINSDEPFTIKEDIPPEAVNYIMGQSAGFVDGFKSAINTIVLTLSDTYRDIQMTEDELYMLIDLGVQKDRAWLKNHKQRKLLEKQGWKEEHYNCVPVWKKEEHAEGEDDSD
jgi:hypothetical protein